MDEEMMEYNEFKNLLVEAVQENVGPEKKVYLKTVKKCNGIMREGITYEYEDSRELISGVPIVYLDDLYEYYEEEEDLADIITCVVNAFMKAELPKEVYDIQNWKVHKNNVFMKLLNSKYNLHMLDSLVHKEFLDLSIIFSVNLGGACMDITKQILETWNVTEEELYQTALDNMKSKGCVIADLKAFLPPMMTVGEDDSSYMFVVTNENRIYGASEILHAERLQEFAEAQDSNMYILPSSRHEMLLIPDDGDVSLEVLQKTVYEINHDSSVMRWEDYLSDSVYYFDRLKGQISIAA